MQNIENWNNTDLSLNNALSGANNALGYYGTWYPDYRYYSPTTTIVVTGHRSCGCPKCAGDCCDCAECKVKRLEKRVAELEKARAEG